MYLEGTLVRNACFLRNEVYDEREGVSLEKYSHVLKLIEEQR